MIDFSFYIPTRFIFGVGKAQTVGDEIVRLNGHKVLIVDDGGSYLIELLGTVKDSLEKANLEYFQMDQKAITPSLSLVLNAVSFCKDKGVDFILAVGGGTVMDTAKAIGFMAVNEGDFTDYVNYKKDSSLCLPVASVVTTSGTGSEISATAMIIDDRTEVKTKYPLFTDSIRFRFSVMDPSITCSLPLTITLSGAFDAMNHIMERYFCGSSSYDLQDRLCESVMSSLLHNMREVVKSPTDLSVRSQLMMSATLANSTLLGLGCDSDWAMHYMENPITTKTHALHGAMLSIISLAWMRYCYKRDIKKAVQFAVRVMGVSSKSSEDETAVEGINALEKFLKDVGLPTRLSEMNVGESDFDALANAALRTAGQDKVGGISKLSKEEVLEIYNIAR